MVHAPRNTQTHALETGKTRTTAHAAGRTLRRSLGAPTLLAINTRGEIVGTLVGAHTATLTHCDTHTPCNTRARHRHGRERHMLAQSWARRQAEDVQLRNLGRPQHVPGRVHRGTCAASCAPGHANTLVNMQTLGHMFHRIHPHTCPQALVPPEGSHTPDIYTHAHIHCPGNSQMSGSWLHAYQDTHTGRPHHVHLCPP